jgi:predicted MFS family arabinose efflux permease
LSVASKLPRPTLALFFAILAVNVMDRQLMAILIEPMKRDLGMTDTQMGLLTGLAFALFYATMGIPIAMLADRADRKIVLAVSSILSSLFSLMCGFATGFWSLLVARVGVAIGDAGGAPTMHSLIASQVAPEERARTLSILQLGVPLGAVFAYAGGGYIAQHYGWQYSFFIVGTLGALLGLLTLIVVKEPRAAAARSIAMPLTEGISGLLGQPAFRWGLAGVALAGIGLYSAATWAPSVLQRGFGFTTSQAGLGFGLATALGGGLGTVLGGIVTHALRKRGDNGAEFFLPAIVLLLTAPMILGTLLTRDGAVALGLLGGVSALLLSWNAPSIAGFQNLSTDATRALVSATHVLAVNLVGLGGGPLLVGVLSDLFTPIYGAGALTLALAAVVSVACIASSFCLWMAARHCRTLSQKHALER